MEGLIAPGTWNIDPSASPAGHPVHADRRQRHAVRAGRAARHRQVAEHVAVSDPDRRRRWCSARPSRRTSRRSRGSSTTGWPRHRTLEFDSTVNYPLDRQEVATTDADRAQHTPWNTYVRPGSSGHTDLLAGAAGAGRGRTARSRGTGCTSSPSTCRAPRCSPGTTSSTWRTSNWPSATVSSTARDSVRVRAGRRCSGRRSRIPGHRNCIWPPTVRSAWTTGPMSASSAPPTNCPALVGGFGPEWVGRVGDDARQVRGAAVRRRTHTAGGTGRVGQHAGALADTAGGPTTPTSTA